jgi:hypothetical protein
MEIIRFGARRTMNNQTLEQVLKRMQDLFGEYNIYDIYFGYDYEDERDYLSFELLDIRGTEFIEFSKISNIVDVVIEGSNNSKNYIKIVLTDKNTKISNYK